MSTIGERAREAQRAHFAEEGDSPESVLATMTLDLYDTIDGLSASDRELLIASALQKVHAGIMAVGALGDGEVRGIALGLNALIAIAGYANETNREASGDTRTGDRKVDDVLETVPKMLKAMVRKDMSPEQAAEMDSIAQRVKDRVARGEDFEEVLDEEAEKIGLKHNHPVDVAESKARSGANDYGVYL